MIFRPVQVSDSVPGLRLVVTGQRYEYDNSWLSSDARELDRLITKACFHAACHATNLGTGYALEKAYGPDGAGTDGWPDHRKYVWDGMGKNGSPGVRQAVIRGDMAVVARLEAVRKQSQLVDSVLSWSAWRHMDLRGLAAEQLAEPPDDATGYDRPTLEWPPYSQRLRRSWITRMRGALSNSSTRYGAINALWYFLRRAVVDSDLLLYIIGFLLWREALARFSADPVLGPIIGELETYTSQRFAVLHLFHSPADADVCGVLYPLGEHSISLKTRSELAFGVDLLNEIVAKQPRHFGVFG